MKHSRCVFNTASALHHIFIAPVEHSPRNFFCHTNAPIPKFYPTSTTLHKFQQCRTYVLKRDSTAVAEERLPCNEEIITSRIRLVGPDKSLQERYTADVLASLNLKEYTLQTVVAGDYVILPICKIINKKEAHAAKKAAKKAGKNPSAIVKTVELNWAIDGNDLGHRLNKVKEFLEKGNKVEVVMAGKKKGRKATVEEAEALVKTIRGCVEGVPGARETKPMEGKFLALSTLYFEGKAQKEQAAVVKEAPVKEAVVEKAEAVNEW